MMISGTTRTDWMLDSGVIDMGFHWMNALSDHSGEISQLLDDVFEDVEEPRRNTEHECADMRLFNHPNPFNPTTTISLIVDEASAVELVVYDMNGRLISTLHRGNLKAGRHQFILEGNSLPTGVYLYRAAVGDQVLTGKAILIK